ncbi:TetR/AcrR family transcriptional regulator [Amycolatopsis anabasis]|uniref:TetR/AcrR family transcriptional regulator n=1 Tax=Amycolatopsis anabasis TaxID=1840409 RepID=UPI00131E6149|nr:TetR/AcrR family transcriptional regulator [Amycolatopsis anabasis]
MAMSASVPGRPRSRHAAGLPAVTPERIVDAALRLTAEHGLENWTLRQLAAAVDAYPAVVYHHVGDREAVVAAVIDRALLMFPLPAEELPWREWFSVLLAELREVLRCYPGVARRLSIHGPSLTAAGPTIDRGVRILQRAGFGAESPRVYTLLLSVACQHVAVEDDRAARDEKVTQRTVEAWIAHRDNTELPGLALMGARVYELVNDPDQRANYGADVYDYAVQRCLDGVAARLETLNRP